MKRYNSWILIYLLTWLFCLTISTSKVEAEDTPVRFSVEAILPENQRDTGKTYFDLRVTPGQQQDLEIELANLTDQRMNLNVQVNPATTNKNGVIDYHTDKQLDSTLRYPMNHLITVSEKKVELKGGEKKRVILHLSVPTEPFQGTVLGGVYVSANPSVEQAQKELKVQNKQSVVKGIQLTENDDVLSPDFKLLGVQADQIGYRNVFLAKIQNPEPIVISDLSLTARVYALDSSKALFEESTNMLKMAPNSYFNYPIFLEDQPFKAGKYRLELDLHTQGRKWHFERKFNISKLEAQKYNNQLPEKKKNQSTHYWIYLGIFLFIIAGAGGWIWKKNQANRKK